VEALHVDGWSGRPAAGEHLGGAVKKLGLPLRNLIGMDVELLRQLGERLPSGRGLL